MSYTYIKTVFPEFEFTNVYNDNLYKNVKKTHEIIHRHFDSFVHFSESI